MRATTGLARKALGEEVVPAWEPPMPPPAPAELPETTRVGAAAVYFPACINRIFGSPGGQRGLSPLSLPAALVEVSRRAGLPVWIPPDVGGRCCAVPWSSKGLRAGYERMGRATAEALWRWSDGGSLPVVVDASSCTLGIADELADALPEPERERHAKLEVIDSVTWALERVAPKLEPRKVASVAIHPTCSGRHLGTNTDLVSLAWQLAEDVTVPAAASCCGFAGDRGFLHPELTDAATRAEADEIAGRDFDAYLSSNRTCEVGLERATGEPYRSPILLLEELTR